MNEPPTGDRDGDPWASDLRAAEEASPRVVPRPLSLGALESSRQRFEARRQVTTLAVILLVLGIFVRIQQNADAPAGTVPLAQVEDALQSLADSLAVHAAEPVSLWAQAAESQRRADAAIERALTSDFRTNFRLAEAGVTSALVSLHELSRRHPNSHGGRCAHAYLASRDPAPLHTKKQ